MIPKIWTKKKTTEVVEYDEVRTVCTGPSDTWASINFENDSDELIMIALDYATKVSTTAKGQLRNCTMSIIAEDTLNSVERLRHTATAGQTWTRVFIPLPRGRHRIRFRTDERYGSSDEVYLRDINIHHFTASKHVAAVEPKPPRLPSGVIKDDTLGLSTRTQRIGNLGAEIELSIWFTSYDAYADFVSDDYASYMLIETPYPSTFGIYGGHMQEMSSPEIEGTLRYVEATFISPQRAGRGVREL